MDSENGAIAIKHEEKSDVNSDINPEHENTATRYTDSPPTQAAINVDEGQKGSTRVLPLAITIF